MSNEVASAVARSTEPEQLIARARFTECLEATNGSTSARAVLCRMRAMLVLGRYHELIRPDTLDHVARLEGLELGRAQALLSSAYFQAGLRVAAKHAREEAYRLARSTGNASLQSEVTYFHALQCWSENQLDEATRLAEEIQRDSVWRAKALELLGWIQARRGDFKGQLTYLRSAWDAITVVDVWTQAAILFAIAASGRDLFDPESLRFVEQQRERMAWTKDTKIQEFHIGCSLAWYAALDGRRLQALTYFEENLHGDFSIACKAATSVYRAYLAYWARESKTDERFLRVAEERVHGIDWTSAGEARFALLHLAELQAQTNPGEAQHTLAWYCDIAAPLSPIVALGSGDLRRGAFEQYAAGVVYAKSGMITEAVEALTYALDKYSAVDFTWRAALAAFRLSEIIDREHYLERGRHLLVSNTPHAWFASIFDASESPGAHAPLPKLTPARQNVLRAFIDGLSNEEIAKRLGISEQLVKRRMSEIYRAFDVKSSRALWSVLCKRGVH